MGICESRGNTDKLTPENKDNPNQNNIASSQQNQNNSSQIANNPTTSGINNTPNVPNNINTSKVVNNNISSLNNTPTPNQSTIQKSVVNASNVQNVVETKVSTVIKNNTSLIKNPNFTCIKSFTWHKDAIVCVIELSSGAIATGSYDKTVCIWKLENQNPYDTIYTSGRVFCLLEFEPGIILV